MTGLCQLASDWRGEVPAGGLMLERKWDGFRCLWFRGIDGQPRLWSRNGMPIEGCDHIAHRMHLLEEAAGCPLFVDGELVVDGTLAATKAWVESGWRRGGEAGHLYAFDIAPYPDWRAGGWDAPLYERKAWLSKLVAEVGEPWDWRPRSHGRDEAAPPLSVLPDTWAFDAREVLDEASRVWALAGEGVMLKRAEETYQRRRTDAWMKVKLGGPWRLAA